MAHTLSSVQPEIARKRGEELHNSVAMFIQGVLSPRGKQQQQPVPEVELAASSGARMWTLSRWKEMEEEEPAIGNKSKEDTIDAED